MRKLIFVLIGFFLASLSFADIPTRDYTTVTKAETTSAALTDDTLWDPDTNYRFVLQSVFISSTGAVDVELEVSNADVIAPVHLDSPGTFVYDLGGRPIYVGAKDAILTWTATILGRGPNETFPSVSILVTGYEELVG